MLLLLLLLLLQTAQPFLPSFLPSIEFIKIVSFNLLSTAKLRSEMKLKGASCKQASKQQQTPQRAIAERLTGE